MAWERTQKRAGRFCKEYKILKLRKDYILLPSLFLYTTAHSIMHATSNFNFRYKFNVFLFKKRVKGGGDGGGTRRKRKNIFME